MLSAGKHEGTVRSGDLILMKNSKELVEQKGFKAFDREILRLCKSKGECSYWEAKLQFDNNVLLSDEYYNGIINCKINSRHLSKESILWHTQKEN